MCRKQEKSGMNSTKRGLIELGRPLWAPSTYVEREARALT